MNILGAIGGIGAAASGIGNLYSAINPGSSDISWGDINKNLAYQKGLFDLQTKWNPGLFRLQSKEKLFQERGSARQFRYLAKQMGVHPLALLGNVPQVGPFGSVQPGGNVQPTFKESRGKAFARMGQDVLRGVNAIHSSRLMESETRINEAKAVQLEIQNDAMINENQRPRITEEDLKPGPPPSPIKGGKALQKQFETHQMVQSTLHNDYIRHMPKQEYSDFLSENLAAQSIFWKDRIQYAHTMNKRGARYQSEKRRLNFKYRNVGRVVWDPTARLDPGVMPGKWARKGYDIALRKLGLRGKAVFGAWKVKRGYFGK